MTTLFLALALAPPFLLLKLHTSLLQGMQALLDVISACDGSVSDSAKLLGLQIILELVIH